MMELAKHKAGVHRGISARGAVLSTESYTLNLKGEQSCSCEFSMTTFIYSLFSLFLLYALQDMVGLHDDTVNRFLNSRNAASQVG